MYMWQHHSNSYSKFVYTHAASNVLITIAATTPAVITLTLGMYIRNYTDSEHDNTSVACRSVSCINHSTLFNTEEATIKNDNFLSDSERKWSVWRKFINEK